MKKGFTLIELLVVIAIITILVSVVSSSVNGRKEKTTPLSKVMTPPVTITLKSDPDASCDESPMSRATNSCLLEISKERDSMQRRFAQEMDDMDNRISKECFRSDN